ncbi:MAG: DNA-processing protein DprA [Chloroflexota bacterium]
MDSKAYWIALGKVPGIGPSRLTSLLEVCGSVEAIWKASIQTLKQAKLDRRSLENLLEYRRTIDLGAELDQVQRHQIQVLTWDDHDYPENLRHIDSPPPVLYIRGALTETDVWAVGIVGTRRASPYGREVARAIATELAQAGVTVISGLALGIDAIAHKAALDAGGRTIAVLGSGVDQLYPATNESLALRMAEQGAVVSEYALGVRPEASNFPPRNRIISGLSKGIVVVEANQRSGALITANFAAEQGRDVFAVPGSILNPSSAGCNHLIQQGAMPFLKAEDVLEQLNLTRLTERRAARRVVTADPMESELLTCLSSAPQYIDDIVRQTDMPSAQVSSLLTMMELKGLVRQVSTLNYVRG